MSSKTEQALCVIGAGLLVGGIVALCIGLANYTPPEPEKETIQVTSKEKRDDGFYCFGGSTYKSCKPQFEYFVNGQQVTEETFNSVEEGKTYLCNKSYDGWWKKCNEEGDNK